MLGFLAEGDERDEDIVEIKVHDDPTTPSRHHLYRHPYHRTPSPTNTSYY